MVVDAIICHWVTLLVETEAVAEVLSVLIQDLAAYFYADDVLITSTQMERM